jgi:hypothetical protein
MTTYSEGTYAGDWLRGEVNQNFREAVTLSSGVDLASGQVLGKIKTSTPTTGTAGTNTGNGTCGSVTAGNLVKIGTYTLTCIAAATNSGTFEVKDPDGQALGRATVAVAYTSSQINFTIADGATDFIVGDKFTIAVTAGSGKYKAITSGAKDGSQIAAGILLNAVDATGVNATGSTGTTSTTGIDYEAVETGAQGNEITIALVDPGANSASLSIAVAGDEQAGWTITASLATDGGGSITSTSTTVSAAINNSAAASALVTATDDGNGSTAVAAESVTLTGGIDYARNNQGVAIVRDAVVSGGKLTHTGFTLAQIKTDLEAVGFKFVDEG